MTEPARLLSEGRPTIELSRGAQYVVRETDTDRAEEISGKFYPGTEAAAEESAEPSPGQSERDEQLARICELARRLGFNDAKTKMLLGQWARNLAELERELLNEFDEQPTRTRGRNAYRHEPEQHKKETGRNSATMTAAPPVAAPGDLSVPPDEGFLF